VNLSSELKIRTPEGVVFSYRLAGPITRSLAWGIDVIIVSMLTDAAQKAMAVLQLFNPDFGGAVAILLFFGISVGYGILLEWLWRGQTVGKRVLNLRVLDATGLRLQFHQCLLRNLLRVVDCLPAFYLVGGLTALLNRRAQRLGDLAAGTVVVHSPRHAEPNLAQLLAGKFNSLRNSPHLAGRLRQRVSPDEARLALTALLRRDSYHPEARIALFAELAAHFKGLVAFPAEDIDALPDEQYVRNVVDILFRTKAEPVAPRTEQRHAALAEG
jgi:uncharacterized RDD family membrane protein YckC